MNTRDWRVVMGLVLGAALLAPWSTLGAALLLGGAAYVALQGGIHAWRGGPLAGRPEKETYWRGRRIDRGARANGTWSAPVWPPVRSVVYLALGTGLAAVAFSMLLAVVGRG